MNLLERIAADPAVRFGKPCVRGTRITVGDVLGYLASGMSEQQLIEDFPQLTHDDVRACLAYAAERERRTLGFRPPDPCACSSTSNSPRSCASEATFLELG
jgi:uncharacterized protein (DUF433 family)